MILDIKKVINLPEVLAANTVYFHVDTGDGLVVTVTDNTGAVVRGTKTTAEILALIQSYTDAEIDKVKAMIPAVWENILTDHTEVWGSMIYILQSSDSLWRIKRIDETSLVTFSNSSDTENAELAMLDAWDARGTLIYA